MIVIKLEMWPRGDHRRARSLGVATIENVGGTTSHGDYKCRLFKSREYSTKAEARPIEVMLTRPLATEIWRAGGVAMFDRVKLGPWDLLFRALSGLLRDRNSGFAEPFGPDPVAAKEVDT